METRWSIGRRGARGDHPDAAPADRPSGSRVRNALLTALGVLAAVIVVAVAARGSVPAGNNDTRKASDGLLDILFSLYVITLIGGAVLLVYMLVLRRHLLATEGKTRRHSLLEMTLASLFLLVIGLLAARRLAGWEGEPRIPQEDLIARGNTTLPDPPTSAGRVAEFAWLPVLLTVGLILLAACAWWLAGRARRGARGELRLGLSVAVAQAVDESLEDLRAEPDPRRAVIAAYGRLERVLAHHGVPRRPSEAPLEYLARILTSLEVGDAAAIALTDLFERAKFSHHVVGPEMKEQAIAALETVRDELRVARARAEQALAEAQRVHGRTAAER